MSGLKFTRFLRWQDSWRDCIRKWNVMSLCCLFCIVFVILTKAYHSASTFYFSFYSKLVVISNNSYFEHGTCCRREIHENSNRHNHFVLFDRSLYSCGRCSIGKLKSSWFWFHFLYHAEKYNYTGKISNFCLEFVLDVLLSWIDILEDFASFGFLWLSFTKKITNQTLLPHRFVRQAFQFERQNDKLFQFSSPSFLLVTFCFGTHIIETNLTLYRHWLNFNRRTNSAQKLESNRKMLC